MNFRGAHSSTCNTSSVSKVSDMDYVAPGPFPVRGVWPGERAEVDFGSLVEGRLCLSTKLTVRHASALGKGHGPGRRKLCVCVPGHVACLCVGAHRQHPSFRVHCRLKEESPHMNVRVVGP